MENNFRRNGMYIIDLCVCVGGGGEQMIENVTTCTVEPRYKEVGYNKTLL